MIYSTVLVFSLTDQWSPNVRRFRRFWWSLDVVHGSAVAQNGDGSPRSFARSYSRSWQSRLQLRDVQRWRWHGHSWWHRLVDSTRFFFRLSLMFSHSNLFWFFSSSSLDQRQLHALYKQLQIWKCLRISSSFTQLPECSVMHLESLRPTDYCISCPPDGA